VDIHYSVWLSVIPTLLALAAAAFAYRTSRAAQQALAAAHPRHETRRPAPLTVTVLDGRARRDLASDAREYAFLIAVENGTGAETTIVEAELRVSYRTRANFCGAVDVPMDVEAQVGGAATTIAAQPYLQIPLRLGGGQAASGWVAFRTANVIPRHCRVDAYEMIITDASGARATGDASLPMVLRADTDGRGPATWGWD
jgi:hypothetical protein